MVKKLKFVVKRICLDHRQGILPSHEWSPVFGLRSKVSRKKLVLVILLRLIKDVICI